MKTLEQSAESTRAVRLHQFMWEPIYSVVDRIYWPVNITVFCAVHGPVDTTVSAALDPKS